MYAKEVSLIILIKGILNAFRNLFDLLGQDLEEFETRGMGLGLFNVLT